MRFQFGLYPICSLCCMSYWHAQIESFRPKDLIIANPNPNPNPMNTGTVFYSESIPHTRRPASAPNVNSSPAEKSPDKLNRFTAV